VAAGFVLLQAPLSSATCCSLFSPWLQISYYTNFSSLCYLDLLACSDVASMLSSTFSLALIIGSSSC
jgi:hypothetical protein